MIRLRQSSENQVHRSLLLLLVMLVAISGVTCDLPPSFGLEYDDTSRNFISAYPLAAPTLAGNAEGVATTDLSAVWDWSWREKTGTTFEYMTLTSAGTVGTTVTSGAFKLEATDSVWRLELVNLAGDPYFEEGSIPAGWVAPAPATMSLKTASNYHGTYLELKSNSNSWAGFDPNTIGFILDDPGSHRSNTYRLAAYSTQPDIKYLIDDYNIATFDNTIKFNTLNNEMILDTFDVPDSNTRTMFAVPDIAQTVEIDDLRICRNDISNTLALRIRLKPSDTEIDLAPGLYEFSVWVKVPSDALSFTDDSRQDSSFFKTPFAADNVRLELRQVGFSEIERTTPLYFSESFATSTDWTRLALRMDGNLDRFERSSEYAVIELAIYPFDVPGTISPGSVLIAAPSLRFFKDGYTD